MPEEAKEHPQTLYEAVEMLYHYAESIAMRIAFDQWMHTTNYEPQELTDSHMSTLGFTAYETWKVWYSIKHPILKPAIESIASAALIRLGGTACQTSKEEYQIVEWMGEMLWDGLQKDLARSRKNDAAKQTCCGECKTSCTECSEVPAEPQTEKPEEAAIEHSSSCLFDITVECDAAIRSSYAIAERIMKVCADCEHRKEADKRQMQEMKEMQEHPEPQTEKSDGDRRCMWLDSIECVKENCFECEAFATLHACVITADDEEEEE